MIAALLLAAAAAGQSLTICADRPAKANSACIVPAAHWQLEVSGVDWTLTKDGGSRIDATAIGQTLVKLGLTDDSDIELSVSPRVEVESYTAGVRDRASGIGDTVLRFKKRLSDPSAAAQIAVIPFVKLPTAGHALGNAMVEGGLAVPLSFSTKAGATITLGPEVDVLADGDGHGRHLGLTNLVNVAVNPAPRLTLSAELWNAMNFDPRGTIRSWSADVSAAYVPGNRFQLDGGANFGLNRSTADVELYVGASFLF